ncbi:MAG: HSPB1-associated protein 1, partial [Marteilia pararefringens]
MMNTKNVQDEYLQQIINCKPWEEVFRKFGDSGKKTGENLNLWWGSSGSYTPCHFDSYGVNVVFQVSGRKLWILYPPENYHNMYPTRLPYEDSSIFSQLDPVRPNFSKFPRFQSVASHAIILEEGDVLFVPKHWWHYVECLNDSLSINCWFDL